MSESFNDKHLLWWVLKAVEDDDIDMSCLLDAETWERIRAPEWVLPAMQEKIEEFRKR